VVDNRPGANGTLGCDLVAKAPPDGYTMVLGDIGCMSMAPGLYPKLPYDPLRDFAPVTLVARSPLVLTVGATSPSQSVKELIERARANPGKLNYPSSGTGGPNHMGGELFAIQAKLDITHIPYKGSAPGVVSLVAGETDFGFLTAVTIASQLQAGKLRALAVASNERLASMPNVPTMSEAGVPGFEAEAWFMAAVPAGTPKAIVDRLNAEIAKALPAADVKEKLAGMGASAVGNKPEAATAFLRSEVDKWGRVIKTANIKLD
jgi:tripartite-type tricarboxylate transporter receptor subunit TctC